MAQSRKKEKKKITKNPFRPGSWGSFVYETLAEISKVGNVATVSEIYAAIHQKRRLSRYTKLFGDPKKLRKKTYFALWEMLHKKQMDIVVSKRDKETTYQLRIS